MKDVIYAAAGPTNVSGGCPLFSVFQRERWAPSNLLCWNSEWSTTRTPREGGVTKPRWYSSSVTRSLFPFHATGSRLTSKPEPPPFLFNALFFRPPLACHEQNTAMRSRAPYIQISHHLKMQGTPFSILGSDQGCVLLTALLVFQGCF